MKSPATFNSLRIDSKTTFANKTPVPAVDTQRFKTQRLLVSHSASKFQSHKLTEDPDIKARLSQIAENNAQLDSARALTDHLPTEQGNADLLGLHVVGQSVFELEKAHAMKLIAGCKLGNDPAEPNRPQ